MLILCLVSNKRHNISTRTTLNSIQLIHRSINNGAKLMRMRILKLPAKILYYCSDEFNKICKIVFLCVSIQIAARISTGKSDMAIVHCWICVRPSDCASVTVCFLNILKNHRWNFIKFCKHIHMYKANTSNKTLRSRGQYYWSYFPL